MMWFAFPAGLDVVGLVRDAGLDPAMAGKTRRETFILDSAAGGLASGGLCLSYHAGILELRDRVSFQVLPWTIPESTSFPVSALPPGVFRNRVEVSLKERPLVAYGPIAESAATIWVCRTGGKRVARLTLGKSGRFRWIELAFLKGYETEAAPIAKALEAVCPERFRVYPPYLLLRETGKAPLPLGESVVSSDTPAPSALQAAAASLAGMARASFRTFIEGTDPEGLHDARVYLRKLRTVAALTHKLDSQALPREELERLVDLGKSTNTARDLEVLAANRSCYEALVPTFFASGLKSFFDKIDAQAAKEVAELRTVLVDSGSLDGLAELAAAWDSRSLHLKPGPGTMTAGTFMEVSVDGRLRKIRKASRAVISNPRDPFAVHALRVAIKKYRYLLEIFAAILGERLSGRKIGAARQAQDILGRVHDLDVQVNGILGRLAGLSGDDPEPASTASALGALASRLAAERDRLSVAIPETLAFLED